ncbi:MAG: radical SAM protein [Patescibacteria group bacterium]|jgi:radical SAM protein with 4Fe4S-binding SPASM domain
MLKKINNSLNKIEMALGRKKIFSYPKYAQIEPTNRCNQRCIMCPRNDQMDVPLGDLTLENFKSILKQIPTLTDIQLNGLGEPLLNNDIFEMIKCAKSKNINITVTSNLALATSEKAKKLVAAGPDLLKISMDSTDPEIYHSIRNGNLEDAITGIKNVIRAKKEAGSKKPSIWFNSIIMNKNVDGLIKILKLAEELGVDMVRFKPIDTFDLYSDRDLLVERNKLIERIKVADEESKKIKIRHNLSHLIKNFSTYYRPQTDLPCFSPWYELYIQYYGGVRLCCEFYSKKYDIGNMFEESFKSVWNGKKMQQIRAEFKKGHILFPVCKTCNRFQRNIQIHNKLKKLKLK